jgi:two-component system chemotaxis response regulator CheB
MKRILIAEDDATSAYLLEHTLANAGYEVVKTSDGVEALDAIIHGAPFDALITDWMMPNMDGIALIRKVRAEIEHPPVIMVITALAFEESRRHALDSGADDYLAKPYKPSELNQRLELLFARQDQEQAAPRPRPSARRAPHVPATLPPCVGVVIATSTGGPPILRQLLKDLPVGLPAAYFLVQHGPDWMMRTFIRSLQAEIKHPLHLAVDGMRVQSGHIYLAPGDHHMIVDPTGRQLMLLDGPPVNFVMPAADPLFESAARIFGRYCVAVVLTGLGRDGVLGSDRIAEAGGVVLVQDPMEATASGMPRAVIEIVETHCVLPSAMLGAALGRQVKELAARLPAMSAS